MKLLGCDCAFEAGPFKLGSIVTERILAKVTCSRCGLAVRA